MDNQEFTLIMAQITNVQTTMTSLFSGVNGRLDKINGRVGKTEDEIQIALVEKAITKEKQEKGLKELNELYAKVDEIDKKEMNHVSVCPVLPKLPELDKRIRVLEDSNLATISKSGLMKSALATLAIFVSVTVGIMKIGENHAEANTGKLIKNQDTLMYNQSIIYKELQNLIKNDSTK